MDIGNLSAATMVDIVGLLGTEIGLRYHRMLTDALKKAGAKTELFTIPGGGHGNFKADERSRAYAKIREFLTANGL